MRKKAYVVTKVDVEVIFPGGYLRLMPKDLLIDEDRVTIDEVDGRKAYFVDPPKEPKPIEEMDLPEIAGLVDPPAPEPEGTMTEWYANERNTDKDKEKCMAKDEEIYMIDIPKPQELLMLKVFASILRELKHPKRFRDGDTTLQEVEEYLKEHNETV